MRRSTCRADNEREEEEEEEETRTHTSGETLGEPREPSLIILLKPMKKNKNRTLGRNMAVPLFVCVWDFMC